jgi:hypothetical protein
VQKSEKARESGLCSNVGRMPLMFSALLGAAGGYDAVKLQKCRHGSTRQD